MPSVFVCRCHDPLEQGARTPSGVSEWQLAEVINREIRNELWSNDCRALYFHKTLSDRVQKINVLSAKDKRHLFVVPPTLAIEVHCNWTQDTSRHGFFVMAHRCSARGRRAAGLVLGKIAKLRPKAKNMGVNLVDRNRQWIGTEHEYPTNRQYFICETNCPAILVEAGFLSNPPEAEWLLDRDNRERLGKAIGQGLAEYMKEERA